MTDAERIALLESRMRLVEDELAIRTLILSYGPAADAGLAEVAASAWLADGSYDWKAGTEPFEGPDGVAAMLRSDAHRRLMDQGVAHVAGPPVIDVAGDEATAVAHAMVMRRDHQTGRFFLWRLSAARWELERLDGVWKVRRRTHRLLDDTGEGHELFAVALAEMAAGGTR